MLIGLGIFLLRDEGSLTDPLQKRLISLVPMTFGLVCSLYEYGGLRGLIIFLALVSLLGTLMPFVPAKNISVKP